MLFGSRTVFFVIVKLITFLALWDPEAANGIKKILYELYRVVSNVILVMLSIGVTVEVFNRSNNLLKTTENICKAIIVINALLKVVSFLSKKRRIMEHVKKIKESDYQTPDKILSKLNTITIIMYLLTTVGMSGFVVYSYFKGSFPYGIWLPFELPPKDSIEWLFLFLVLVSFYTHATWRLLGIDLFVINLMIYYCHRLDDLTVQLQSLKPGKGLKGGLNACIEQHVDIMRGTNEACSLFAEILLVQTLAESFELCLTTVMLRVAIKRGNVQESTNFFGMMALILFNGFMCCYFGDELIEKSQGVVTAAHRVSWIDWPLSMQRDLIMIIRCGQRPLHLTAGKISNLSLRGFAKIVNQAYGIFAILYDLVD